jgi:integrase
MFWAPILAMYQGLRVNEIGQLYLNDVFEHQGRWYLRITDEGPAQRLKNSYSRRTLPVRQEVIDCGFVEFIEQAKRWGRITLFPDVVWGPNGPGETISRWFNYTFLRNVCQITDRRHTFHSFRHTFANAAQQVNLRKDHIARLLGHTPGSDVLTLHYFGRDERPEALLAVMNAVNFPTVPHGRYKPEKFEAVFRHAKAEAERNQAMDRRLAHRSPPSLAMLP